MLDAVVIGAGFSGLYQLFCLQEKLGLNVKLLEAGEGVGGTWYWNRYPGARCDSESHVYCYTFSKSLTEDWNWSERYPGPTEIVKYLNHVTDRFELRRSIDFGTRVVSAQFSEEHGCWDIETEWGQCYRARFLITAVGCLSSASVPEFDGLEHFQGEWYHTGQWPPEGVQFEGKRVGQIGTGSTGIQAAPVIAKTAQHLTVFQRTANFSVPARNHALTIEERAVHKRNAAETRELTRTNSNGHSWLINNEKAVETSAEDRTALYEMITGPGSPSVLTNMPSAIEQHVEWISDCIAYMRKQNYTLIESPELSGDSWVSETNAEANKTLLPKVSHSWYLGANIPGKPRVFMPYAGGLDKYRNICQKVADENYKGFNFS